MKEQPALTGFVLIGGSALALRLQHRWSEDLDLAYRQPTLPRARLEALLQQAGEAGFDFQRDDDEAAVQEFVVAGMELHDCQQDFLVNDSVNVSFFTADNALAKVLSTHAEQPIRVATLTELFKAKCLVSALRSKTRDWLDLFLLMRDHGFSIHDYQGTFREAGIEGQCGIGLSRLCGGVPQKDDEGYAHLLDHPPALADMKNFFVAQRDKLEIETAAEALRRRQNQEGESAES